jgi:hypothetical protein
MDYFEIYRELKAKVAESIGKPAKDLVPWRDYDPIDLDYQTLDLINKAKREANKRF